MFKNACFFSGKLIMSDLNVANNNFTTNYYVSLQLLVNMEFFFLWKVGTSNKEEL